MTTPHDELSLDAIFEGRLLLRQPRKGYRFAVDAALLVWFAHTERSARTCLDLGAGCGIVGLGLLATGAARELVAVEIQPRLAELCSLNATLNELADRTEVITTDALATDDRLPAAGFDLVVANPPFWPTDKGQLPEDEERKIACHEVTLTLAGWTTRAAELMTPRRGRLCVVFPARRIDELLLALDLAGLSATKMVMVHPHADESAELVLLEARPGSPGRIAVLPTLVLRGPENEDTTAATEIISGNYSAQLRARGDRRTA
ncbi:MAG: methyltransferase [Deltaproteobacteria bacterium]|nr:methyltransferase [Deltaproteobacteria bacterium]